MTPRDVVRGVVEVYRQAFAGLPRATWLISLVAFVNRAGTMVVVFLPVWLVKVHGLEEHAAAAFMSLWGAGSVLGVPLGGWLTDRIGALPVQLMSLAAVAFAFVALSGQTDLTAVGAIVFLIGVVGDAFRPANAVLLSATCPPEARTRAFALHRLAINTGLTVGPVAGGLLSEVSWPLVFWVDAATCGVAALVLGAAFRGAGNLQREQDARATAAAPGPWRDPLFLALFGCLVLLGLVFMQFFSTFTVYLSEGLDCRQSTIGALAAINPVVIAILEMLLVRRLRRANPVRAAAWGAACVAVGFGLLWVSGSLAWVVICVLVFTVGEMLEAPFTAGFVANRAPDGSRGRYMALYSLSFSIAFVLAPLVGGLVRWSLGWTALWVGCGVVGLLASLGLFLVARAVDREAAARGPAVAAE